MTRLFSVGYLSDILHLKSKKIPEFVTGIPKDQFLASTDKELVDHVVDRHTVRPLVLKEDNIRMEDHETNVDVSHDLRRVSPYDPKPVYVPGMRYEIYIPFAGDSWLLNYEPNITFSVMPEGEVQREHIRLEFELTQYAKDTDIAKFKSSYEAEIKMIRDLCSNISDMVDEYNKELPRLVQEEVDRRRKLLKSSENIASILNIPINIDTNAPSITPVKIEVHRPRELPKPAKGLRSHVPEIADEDFGYILGCIRHLGRSFEHTPKALSSLGEEYLRDLILASLNSFISGGATGETFRKKGKTDICIEYEDRAAFIGECKIWKGQSVVQSGLEQLLSYLTWRDSKTALIIFNKKVKNFSVILDKIPKLLKNHLLYIRNLNSTDKGEWRVLMRSKDDEKHHVTVHVFIFNIFP